MEKALRGTHEPTDERRRLEREAKVASALREVAGALGASLELDELLELVLGRLKDLLEADGTLLFLLDERKRELISRTPGSDARLRVEVQDGFLASALRTGRLGRFSRSEAAAEDLEWDGLLGIESKVALAAPLKNNLSRSVGVIVVYRTESERAFSEDDEEVLGVLAKQAAIAIDNSRLLVTLIRKNQQLQQAQEQLTRRVRDLELLFELERATAHAHSHEDLGRAVLERLARACNAEAAVLSLREGESSYVQEFRLERAPRKPGSSEDAPTFSTTRRLATESVLSQVLLLGHPVQLDQGEGSHSPSSGSLQSEFAVRSFVGEPLDGDEGPIGAFGVLNKRQGPFTAEDLGLVRLVSANVSTAVRLFDASRARERQERLSSIGRLLSQVVHDLKSPLTVISGYVELMRDTEEHAEREKHAAEILKQFQTLGAMQREVLAFARGETQVFLRKVLLDRYFEELVPQLRALLDEGVKLETKVQPKLVAHFDSERVTRALSNLVRNASEAFDGRPGTITVGAEARGPDLLLAVEDDGPGIPDAIVPRLFESFVTHGKKEGTGLGLAIVQRIAVEHGGRVEVVPVDHGASFLLTLPGAVRTKSAPDSLPEKVGSKRRQEPRSEERQARGTGKKK